MSNTPSDDLRHLLQYVRSALWQPANAELCARIDDALARWGVPQPVAREPLTDEQIEAIDTRTLGHQHFARAIEAEVRKQDDALIRQMHDALEYAYRPLCMCFAGCDNCDPTKEIPDAQAAITAARARLGEQT